MRIAPIVLLLGAIALAAPGAVAVSFELAQEEPSEMEASLPSQQFSVDGQEIAVDTEEAGNEAPVSAEGGVQTGDLDVDAQGPRCRLGPHVEFDDVSTTCDAGRIDTNADATLVQTHLDLRIGEIEAASPEGDDSVQAASGTVTNVTTSGTVMLAAAAAGASTALLYGLWRLLKWTGIAALLPLYSHISDDEILDDPNRAAIYRLIQQEAGIATKDIADNLNLAWGTVTHHLMKLEKRRFVVSKKYGKYRRYFANGQGGSDKKDALAVLRLDRTGDIAALITAHPGMTQKAVSTALGVSSSTILWHVKRLEQVALIRKERDGKLVRYFPSDRLRTMDVITPPVIAA